MPTGRFEGLPDLGMYIRLILQKRLFTGSSVKHFRRCKGLLSCRPEHPGCAGEGSPAVDPTPIAFAETYVDGLCCSLLQDSIPCMRKAKRSTKSSVFSVPSTSVEVAACINVLSGTLLSLYPRAVRRPTFAARVPMASRLRGLLCCSRGQQLEFLEGHPSLVRLCFMEYLVNVLGEFMPEERDVLCRTPSMSMYMSVCQTTCDSFRSETLSSGLEPWGQLDSLAGSFIDRCIRMCKFKMYRTREPTLRLQQLAQSFDPACLELPSTNGCVPLLQQLAGGSMSDASLRCAVQVQTMFCTHPLPRAITEMQLRSVAALHGSCSKRSFAVCHLHVCCLCALMGRGIKTPMRMCSETGEISCTTCRAGTVVVVSMLGVLLRVCNTTYYMCPSCTSMRLWSGDTTDLCPSGAVGGRPACRCHHEPEARGGQGSYPIGWNGSPGDVGVCRLVDRCAVCRSKYTGSQHPIYVPDTRRRVLRRVILCSKHRPPEHVLRNVWCYEDLKRSILEHARGPQAGARG